MDNGIIKHIHILLTYCFNFRVPVVETGAFFLGVAAFLGDAFFGVSFLGFFSLGFLGCDFLGAAFLGTSFLGTAAFFCLFFGGSYTTENFTPCFVRAHLG